MRTVTSLMLGAAGAAAPFALALAVPANDGPSLWRIEAIGQAGHPIYMCADASLRRSLVQAVPAINGRACIVSETPKRTPGHFEVRCRTPDAIAVASSAVQGDPARDFTVNTRISTRPADPTKAEPQGEFSQIRRYLRVGPCPAGWGVGDSAAAGDHALVNSRSNVKRPLTAAFSPPAP